MGFYSVEIIICLAFFPFAVFVKIECLFYGLIFFQRKSKINSRFHGCSVLHFNMAGIFFNLWDCPKKEILKHYLKCLVGK
jgi:hypothetical protein